MSNKNKKITRKKVNSSNKKTSKKTNKKQKKQKQIGGGWDPGYNAGGMTWNYGLNFVEDIVGTVLWGVASLVNGVETVTDLVNIKRDMGTAFSAKNAPNPDSIDVGSV